MRVDNLSVEHIVKILGRESQYSIASKLFDIIPVEEYSLDVKACTTVLHSYARTGKYKRAIEIFEKMKETGLDPTLVTYNVMLDVYGKMGRSWDKILELLDQIKSRGLVFDDFTCSTVISACGREEALNIFKEMEDNNCVPDAITYNELVAVGIEKVENEIYDGHVFPSWTLLRTLVLTYYKCRQLRGMVRAFHQLQKNGYKLDMVVINSVLSLFVQNKKLEKAHEMLDLIRNNGLKPNLVTYNSLIDLYARVGDCWKAEEMLKEIRNSGLNPDVVSYNTVIKGFCKKGLVQEAIRILQEMTNNGIQPCPITFNTFLSCYAGKGLFAEADEVIRYMIEHGCMPNELSYKIVIDGYIKAKKHKETMDFVSKIKEIDISFDDQSLKKLASCIREGLET
ncbi:hypothetical protein TSUD_26020 [Trifolium subterraneum]|uniref:Pentacotripeptide-repeat region of PRORP domain-containing protein n=1 Tax=Trifolium subterraneum TaxID=3900 RepID=A0A2Z6NYR1_TRISU|nr:hypothetical protein TSUD_26020 [Trifolium subterraneum]